MRALVARWRRASALGSLALAGPFVLAFFSGGYFSETRAWAGVACWTLLALSLAGGLPRLGRPALLAIAGLTLYAGWTGISMSWAPSVDSAYGYFQIAALYLGALLLSVRLFGSPARAVEPALAAGCFLVVAYGLSERLLPGALHFARSLSAQGRLDQPLTYWNAMGELAAIGFVIATRVAADPRRRLSVRAGAAACGPVLGLGVYLSFSRGALFAAAVGLLSLVVLARTLGQLRVVVTLALAAGLASLLAAPFEGVTSLSGSPAAREAQGGVVLGGLVIIAGLAALAAVRMGRRGEDLGRELPLPRAAGRMTLAAVGAMLAVAILAGAKEGSGRPLSGGASRLETLQSNRYEYWRVALHAFAEQPVQGVGAGGWAVDWLRLRRVNEFAKDAHSLPLQTMAELGVVGLAFLLLFLGGVTSAAWGALRCDRPASVGLLAGFVTWAAHQPLDWDWEMPTLTLVAMILAGTLLATVRPSGGVESPE